MPAPRLDATVTALFLKPARREPMAAASTLAFTAGLGVDGDANAGHRSTRQVLLVSRQAAQRLGAAPGELRENICIDGPADYLSGTELAIGTARLRATYPCDPCAVLERDTGIRPADAVNQRGVLAVVVRSGNATVGDAVHDLGQPYPALPDDWRDRMAWFLARLPAAKVVTYGDLAAAVGQTPVAARAIPRLLCRDTFHALPVNRVVTAGAAGKARERWRWWEAVYEHHTAKDNDAQKVPA